MILRFTCICVINFKNTPILQQKKIIISEYFSWEYIPTINKNDKISSKNYIWDPQNSSSLKTCQGEYKDWYLKDLS